jgi:hypothetical protein
MAKRSVSRRTKRSVRKSRRSSRRVRRQRGGATLELNCSLGSDNKVTVASPPAGITITPASVNTLQLASTNPITDITFRGPPGAVSARYLGTGTGIKINNGTTQLVPAAFTTIRSMTASQRALNPTGALAAGTTLTITNLNTSNLGLSASNRNFTVTITTNP